MEEANERFPDHVGVLFSTACWEALDGRPDDAWRRSAVRSRSSRASASGPRATTTSRRCATGSRESRDPLRSDTGTTADRLTCGTWPLAASRFL